MRDDTGGPAFPAHGYTNDGMTLRDYFAAQLMPAILPHFVNGKPATPATDLNMALAAYCLADAMLKARAS